MDRQSIRYSKNDLLYQHAICVLKKIFQTINVEEPSDVWLTRHTQGLALPCFSLSSSCLEIPTQPGYIKRPRSGQGHVQWNLSTTSPPGHRCMVGQSRDRHFGLLMVGFFSSELSLSESSLNLSKADYSTKKHSSQSNVNKAIISERIFNKKKCVWKLRFSLCQ